MSSDTHTHDGGDDRSANHSTEGSGGPSTSRRNLLKATGGGLSIALVAGCTGNGGGNATTTTTSSGGNGGTTTGTTTKASIEGPITIGAMGPSDSPTGTAIFESVKLAASEINDAGGIGGAEVKVVTKDTKSDPSTGRSVYQELTTGEHVDLTVGIFTSEVLLTILPLMAQTKTIHLTAGAATPEAATMVKDNYDSYKYWFRTGPVNSHYLGVNMVDFAKAKFSDMGFSSVAVLAEDFKWTQPITKILDDQLSSTGVDVPYSKRVAGDTQDFTPIYDEIQSHDVDAVYTVLAHIGSTSLVQWAKQQRPFQYGGIHVPAQLPAYYGLTKGAARYVFGQNTAVPNVGPTDKSVPYAKAYNEMFDGYPNYVGYGAYDAVYIYKNAVESAGSTNSDDLISPLEATSYDGTGGHVEFYGKNETYPHDLKYGKDLAFPLWFQWQEQSGNGTQVVFYPDDLADGSFKPAPWTQ